MSGSHLAQKRAAPSSKNMVLGSTRQCGLELYVSGATRKPGSSRQGVGTVHAPSNIAASL